jgi:phenylacetate-CoA ligase
MKAYELFIEKLVYPVFDIVTGSKLSSYLRELRTNENLEYDDMKKIQNAKLIQDLTSAKDNLGKYKNVEYSPDAEVFLKNFPIMTRSDLSKDAIGTIIDNYDKNGTLYSSGGSTGQFAYAYLSNKEYSYAQATQLHWLSKIGYKPGDKILHAGIKKTRRLPTKRIKDLLLNTSYIFYFEMTEQEKAELLKSLLPKKNMFLISFPTIALDIADICKKYSIGLKFKGILAFGETLSEANYSFLTDFFEAKVINTYGCREGVLIAAGVSSGNLPIMMENTYVEIVDDHGNNLPPSSPGNILFTNLNAYNMPLIRYKIGDIGALAPFYAGQKRDSIEYIIGRDNDVIMTPEGNKFPYSPVIEHDDIVRYKVKMYQWHQRSIDLIQVKYVPGEAGSLTDEDKEYYTRLLLENFRTDKMKIEYIEVEQLTKYKSGKVQRVINDLMGDKSDLVNI